MNLLKLELKVVAVSLALVMLAAVLFYAVAVDNRREKGREERIEQFGREMTETLETVKRIAEKVGIEPLGQ